MRRYLGLQPIEPSLAPPLIRRLRAAASRVTRVHRLVVRWRHVGIAPSDVILVAYPKSGSTWLAGMLVHLATGREFSFDDHDDLAPPVGAHRGVAPILPGGGRLIRSHHPYLDPIGRRYRRVVCLVRDGRDVATSFYHHFRRMGHEQSFEDFFGPFLTGSVDGWGSWHDHVRSWLDSPQARDGRLHVVRYEDLVADPEAVLARIADFVGLQVDAAAIHATVTLHTAARMQAAERSSRFHAKQVRPDILFVRRATPGEFREMLTAEDVRRFDVHAGAVAHRLGYGVAGRHDDAASPRS